MLLPFFAIILFIVLSTILFNSNPNNLKFILITIVNWVIYYFLAGKWLLILISINTLTFFIGLNLHKSKKKIILVTFLILIPAIIVKIYYQFNMSIVSTGDEVIIPVGLTIYVLQSISYLRDIYNQRIEPIKSGIKFTAISSYFPFLLKGPIIQYNEFSNNFLVTKKFNFEMALEGLILIFYGLCKKMIVSEHLTKLFSDFFQVKSTPGMSLLTVVLAPIFLFVEYSALMDIIHGISKLYNLNFIRNYNSPLTQNTFEKMLKNWNSSLYQWVKNYLYLPLCSLGSSEIDKRLWQLLIFIFVGGWLGFGPKLLYISLTMFLFFITEKYMEKIILNFRNLKIISAYSLINRLFAYIGIVVISLIFLGPNPHFVFVTTRMLLRLPMKTFVSSRFFDMGLDTTVAILTSLIVLVLELYKTNIKTLINKMPVALRWSIVSCAVIVSLLFYTNNKIQFFFLTI